MLRKNVPILPTKPGKITTNPGNPWNPGNPGNPGNRWNPENELNIFVLKFVGGELSFQNRLLWFYNVYLWMFENITLHLNYNQDLDYQHHHSEAKTWVGPTV